MQADLAEGALVPELEFDGGTYRCFTAEDPASLPESRKLTLTPREFTRYCLDHDPSRFFACTQQDTLNTIFTSAQRETKDECQQLDLATSTYAKNQLNWLGLTLRLIVEGKAVLLGTSPPIDYRPLPVWFAKNYQPGGGHAVLAVGHLSYADLLRVEEQDRGLLGAGTFEALAGALDPAYKAMVDAGELPQDPEALRDVRVASTLGKIMQAEGGIVLFRNSWGERFGDEQIGAGGYQSITFELFANSVTLLESISTPSIPGVEWQPDLGPAYCPEMPAVETYDPWFTPQQQEALAAHFKAQWTKGSAPDCSTP